MVLFTSQNSSSKSDNRAREIKYISKTYSSAGERGSESGERGIWVKQWKETLNRGGKGEIEILFEMSPISLWVVMYASFFLICFAVSGLWSRWSTWLTLAHWLQLVQTKGLSCIQAPWAPVPPCGNQAGVPGPGPTRRAPRAPRFSRAHTAC